MGTGITMYTTMIRSLASASRSVDRASRAQSRRPPARQSRLSPRHPLRFPVERVHPRRPVASGRAYHRPEGVVSGSSESITGPDTCARSASRLGAPSVTGPPLRDPPLMRVQRVAEPPSARRRQSPRPGGVLDGNAPAATLERIVAPSTGASSDGTRQRQCPAC